MPLLGRMLSCAASCVVVAGTAFFVLAPDLFWDLDAIPAEDTAMIVLGIVSAVAAVTSTVAAFTADQPASLPTAAAQPIGGEHSPLAARSLSEQR